MGTLPIAAAALLDALVDPGEKRVYFEIGDYATNYVFTRAPVER